MNILVSIDWMGLLYSRHHGQRRTWEDHFGTSMALLLCPGIELKKIKAVYLRVFKHGEKQWQCGRGIGTSWARENGPAIIGYGIPFGTGYSAQWFTFRNKYKRN